jgi:hypothetical protein
MKSLTLLWQSLAHEHARRCHTSTDRDFKTVTARVEDEGVSFLTISLTNYGKDFERSLAQGFVDSNQFQGFRRGSGGLPLFLGGFLHLVFDTDGTGLLPEPSIEAIHAVRQLTLVFGKILLPCSKERVEKAMENYVQIESDIRIVDKQRFSGHRVPGMEHDVPAGVDTGQRIRVYPVDFDGNRMRRVFHLLFGDLFARMEQEVRKGCLDSFMPKHGPGATADRLVGNQKFNQSEWPERLSEYFPAGEFVFSRWGLVPNSAADFNTTVLGSANALEEGTRFRYIEPGQERPVRVVPVPKTLKTPRLIAIEPTAMQYAQQAVLSRFLKGWRQDDILSSLLGFDDQVPNQELARQSSQDGTLATLDLSEASDRVSNQLVKFLLQDFPEVAGMIQACRSLNADVPDYGVLPLAKFASMGSALTFPVEAMVFLTLIVRGIEESSGQTLSRGDIKRLRGKVRVYGDDIIVPVEHVFHVIQNLELFGFKINTSKSFWTGKFRESCGKEFYDGHDVSVVRFRREFPTSRDHVEEVISLVEFRNHLYYSGYWSTCQRLDETIVDLIRYFPIVESTSSVIGRASYLPYKAEKMHETLHKPLVRGYVVDPKIPKSNLDGIGALLKWFIAGHQIDPLHLKRGGRPKYVDIKLPGPLV